MSTRYDPKAKPGAGRRVRPAEPPVPLLAKIMQTLQVLTLMIAAAGALSYMINGNFTWNYKLPSWRRIQNTWMASERIFTPEELKQYDGTDPSKPIYLAIMGDVFDVTEGRSYYGPGGGYHFFAGRDAARAYITGCFQTHLTHDIRGLTPDQIKGIDDWRQFYTSGSEKYFKVGRVVHEPIDPKTPIPPPCDDGASAEQGQAAAGTSSSS
ncbi:hypothetical protein GGF31_005467 [Allomyces arbusculus]|nr:hypothetical protein GGF31_005467 [Allomyces arbusculus]